MPARSEHAINQRITGYGLARLVDGYQHRLHSAVIAPGNATGPVIGLTDPLPDGRLD
jgi:hypothetical protein